MIEKILERLEAERVIWAKPLISIDSAKKIVQEVAKEYGNGWIPCSERLPEPYKKVLVYEEDGEIYIAKYHEDIKRFFRVGSAWYVRENGVIAWCELPAPYQKIEQKKAYDEEKCKVRRNFAACADAYCSDDCNMECPYQKGE